MKRAVSRGLLELNIIDIREFGIGKHRQIDDYQYGGGAGMVMMIEPIDKIITQLQSERKYDQIVYLTPDGETWNQPKANQYSLFKNVILLCGHYKGIDERIREKFITAEISIGDFVLSGGELPACILVDSIARLIPGVLNDESSALFDSFQDNLLAPPVYTRPYEYKGQKVPDILLSGNDKAIEDWRHQKSIERTQNRRPDLLED
jgi:tRNA (guanine37-N1)-methyltransferase